MHPRNSMRTEQHTGVVNRTTTVLLMLTLGSLGASPQIAPAPVEKAPAWRTRPPESTSSGVDNRSSAEIDIADRYFDQWTGATDPLDGPQHTATYHSSFHKEVDEDFPSKYRDEVVIAHFSTWVPHLSGSHRSIYTTVNLQIDRVISDKDGHLKEGSVVPLLVPGGTLTIPGTQRVISTAIRGDDFPLEPNTQYLVFLGYRPLVLPFYEYVKAWKIDAGVLAPVSRFDAFRVSQGRSAHNGVFLESAIRELSSR
jgi:hypothetical protein